jgi:hypothetical protein
MSFLFGHELSGSSDMMMTVSLTSVPSQLSFGVFIRFIRYNHCGATIQEPNTSDVVQAS